MQVHCTSLEYEQMLLKDAFRLGLKAALINIFYDMTT